MYAVFLLITVLYLWGTFHVSATVLPVFLEKIPSDWKEEGWVPVATLAYIASVLMITNILMKGVLFFFT